MRLLFSLLLLTLYVPAHAQRLQLSTSSDSALWYYVEGWRQVMDEGDYTASESAYRKMMAHDPDFLVGLSLLGRITRDLQERKAIENKLESRKTEVHGSERLLLDNYIALVHLTNLRETDPEKLKTQLSDIFQSNEKNLQRIVHSFPDEIYYKAEYIEVIHRNHGARAALDSLSSLLTPQQHSSPFLTGYAAHLLAELGDFDAALDKVAQVDTMFEGKTSPKPFVVNADVYFLKGDIKIANRFVKNALKLDPGNIDAQRLKQKIELAEQRK